MIVVGWGANVLRGEVGLAAPSRWASVCTGSQKTQNMQGNYRAEMGDRSISEECQEKSLIRSSQIIKDPTCHQKLRCIPVLLKHFSRIFIFIHRFYNFFMALLPFKNIIFWFQRILLEFQRNLTQVEKMGLHGNIARTQNKI